eukprot:6473369-Amphidinium_carterae.1
MDTFNSLTYLSKPSLDTSKTLTPVTTWQPVSQAESPNLGAPFLSVAYPRPLMLYQARTTIDSLGDYPMSTRCFKQVEIGFHACLFAMVCTISEGITTNDGTDWTPQHPKAVERKH